MRNKIKNSIAKNFKTSHVIVAILTMFVVSFLADMWARSVQTLYQKYSPTDWWYEYESIVPDYYDGKTYFSAWELLRFKSDVTRHKDIDMMWQDKAYCKQRWSIVKYPTQLRPDNGTEFMGRGRKNSSWKYYIDIESTATECAMCGTAVGFTSLWYKKHRSYCVDWFAVNQ